MYYPSMRYQVLGIRKDYMSSNWAGTELKLQISKNKYQEPQKSIRYQVLGIRKDDMSSNWAGIELRLQISKNKYQELPKTQILVSGIRH